MVRVAVAQIDPQIADISGNLDLIERRLRQAAGAGAELAVFPECAVSGYVFQSLDEALAVAEPIPGPASDRIREAAVSLGVWAAVGLLERSGGRVFNTAILAGPNGQLFPYRKTHTLCLGVDRFTTPGDIPYQVHDLPFARVGLLICYDLRFPETARLLALQGAQLILLPTNWPRSSAIQADVFTRSRAAENRVFVLAADRVGVERGTEFLGRSQIVAPDGTVLSEASQVEPELLVADIDPALADIKRVVVRPGEHEMDAMADRRPELYSDLARSTRVAEMR
jgi:predicted amidohydrolase